MQRGKLRRPRHSKVVSSCDALYAVLRIKKSLLIIYQQGFVLKSRRSAFFYSFYRCELQSTRPNCLLLSSPKSPPKAIVGKHITRPR